MTEPAWIVSQWHNAKNHPVVVVTDHDGQRIATIAPYVDRATGRHMTVEHARIIAASKVMLAALTNLVECLELAERNDDVSLPFAGYGREHITRARAAIAKAEGKS